MKICHKAEFVKIALPWVPGLISASHSCTCMADLKERIAATVRARRKLRGMSQDKLVEKLGINVESLSSIERGANLPSVPTLVKLAEALEFDIAKLLMPRKMKVDQDRARLEAEVVAIIESMPKPVLVELRDIALVLAKRGKS